MTDGEAIRAQTLNAHYYPDAASHYRYPQTLPEIQIIHGIEIGQQSYSLKPPAPPLQENQLPSSYPFSFSFSFPFASTASPNAPSFSLLLKVLSPSPSGPALTTRSFSRGTVNMT